RDPEFLDAGHVRKHRAAFAVTARRAGLQRRASAPQTAAAARARAAIPRSAHRPRRPRPPRARAAAPHASGRSRTRAAARRLPQRSAGSRAASSPRRGAAAGRARASASARTGSRRRRRTARRARRRPVPAPPPARAPTSDEQPDRDAGEERGEPERERACLDALLQAGPEHRAHRGGQADDRGGARLQLAVERVADGADQRDQPDRGERGSHRRPLAEVGDQDQQRHDHDSAPDAEEGAEDPGDQADDEIAHRRILRGMDDRLARLRSEPGLAAVLLDVDGTLAPIVARPELAVVPEETRAEVRRLVGRYALVACVTGRTGEEAARLVGVEGVVYVGVHGLELAPEAERWRETLSPFADEDWPWLEDKGLTVAFHWRQAPDGDEAQRTLEAVAERAEAAGLVAHWGRKVLELRPPVEADK